MSRKCRTQHRLMMQKESIYAMGISLTDACDEIE